MSATFTDPRVPENAQRVPGGRWLPVTDIKGHDGRVWTFKPANIVFLDGGSLYWFEQPDTFCVMHARGSGEIVRYPGEWKDAEPVPVPEPPTCVDCGKVAELGWAHTCRDCWRARPDSELSQ